MRLVTIINRLFLAAVCLGMILSFLFAGSFATWLMQPAPSTEMAATLIGLRFEMLLGIAMALGTDRMLTPLGRMIESARAGDPFIAANARRLQAIGWWLLFLQMLIIPSALLVRFFPSLGSAAPSDDYSVGGWVAVLMVFVLSRVFAAGAVMRDELEGTI